MDKRPTIIKAIKRAGLLPLFYHDSSTVCVSVVKALYEAGVPAVEFTNRGAHALANFKILVQERDANMPGLFLGVGTISGYDEARAFAEAGADFLISPYFDEGVNRFAHEAGILWLPGCMTPTEIQTARKNGCTIVKLFPGNVIGPGFVSAVLPVFREMDFVVTGGVQANSENLKSWLDAGVAAVGMGSNLISSEIISTGSYGLLRKNTAHLLEEIDKITHTIRSKFGF